MRSIIILISLLLAASAAQAQSAEAVASAFQSSIDSEAEGNFAEAIKAMKKVYNQDHYEVNLRLGWLNYLAGSFTESTSYYERACSLMPLSVEARLGYVLPASALGNWSLVETKYREVLSIDSKNSLVNYRMGLLHYGREDYPGAERYFQQVVNHYPFDLDGLLMLGWTNFKQGKTREAKILFTKVLWVDANNASAVEGLGLIR